MHTREKLKLLVVDVDGTMTDSGIYYDGNGNELKKFSTRDAAGFSVAHAAGIKIVVLTGRESEATAKRVKELQVDYFFQNIKDKRAFLIDFLEKHQIRCEEVGYIGDDLNDLSSMKIVRFIGCPADSCQEIKEIAHYVSKARGGEGVVRDVVEYLLRPLDEWKRIAVKIYGIGI